MAFPSAQLMARRSGISLPSRSTTRAAPRMGRHAKRSIAPCLILAAAPFGRPAPSAHGPSRDLPRIVPQAGEGNGSGVVCNNRVPSKAALEIFQQAVRSSCPVCLGSLASP